VSASSSRRGLSRLVTSHRRRRRLGFLLAGGVLAGAVTVGVLHLPDSGERLPSTRHGKPTLVAPAPEAVALAANDLRAARGVAAKFVATAVLRHHTGDSWDVTAPSMRTGFTREAWSRAAIPVVPYPAEHLAMVKWKFDYSIKDHVGLKVSMIPRPHTPAQALIFELELIKVRNATNNRWMVDYWAPLAPGVANAASRSPLASVSHSQKNSIAGAWLLIPVGLLLGLIVFLPVGLLVRGKYQHARAERAYREQHVG
jgi:hypothetical protein